jgi:ParB-like chromosome segregation protein Spo0J
MEVVYLSPDDLIPYPGNAKQHPPEQVERIANSIKAFGWQQPIVVDKDRTVIIGHGRLFAAKELLLDKVPVVFADNLTEDQVNALRLADNKTNESAWDFGKLEEELAELSIAGFDMSQFGFDDIAEEMPPENLDNPETYGATVACKLAFDNFIDYNSHEEEIKKFASEIGAVFSVVKA